MTRKLTTITLYKHVPFDDTYKHVVYWNNEDELTNFLDQYPHISIKGSYQNINRPIRWNTGGNGFNDLIEYNYVVIDSIDNTNNQKKFYAFITNYEYLNDGTTAIYYSIDIWNSYCWYVDFNTVAMIKRGFIKEVNDDNTDFSYNFKLIKNNDEEIGGDGAQYQVMDMPVYTNFNDSREKQQEDGLVQFIVFTAQPKDATEDVGSYLGMYTQYRYFFFAYNPKTLETYTIQQDGKEVYKGGKDIADVMAELSKDKELTGSSSLVVDVEQYNYIGLPFVKSDDNKILNLKNSKKTTKLSQKNNLVFVESVSVDDIKPQQLFTYLSFQKEKTETGEVNLTDGDTLFEMISGARSRILPTTPWDEIPYKMLMNPYSKGYLTDGKGTNLTFDLLNFEDYTKRNFYLWRWSGISENGHEVVALDNYNRSPNIENRDLRSHENAMAINDSAKDLPFLNDTYTMYLQANKNQLANTRANAKMNERLAKEGNLVSLQNTNRSINNSLATTNYQNGRNMGMAEFNAVTGVAQGAFGGLMKGGLIGAVGGALGGAVTGGINMYKTGYQNETNATVAAMNANTNRANARANYAFQNKVATNNYEQTIRSQNAMLADVKNHNATVAHQGSSNIWSFQNNAIALHFQIFTSQKAVMQNVITYFNLFGYAINLLKNIREFLNVKSEFNYIQTSDAHINGNLPQPAQNTINTMLDNGVTIWQPTALEHFEVRNQFHNKTL